MRTSINFFKCVLPLFVITLSFFTGSAQNVSYVRSKSITKPGVMDAAGAELLTDPADIKQTTQYLDGLGRLVQTVDRQVSPLLRDRVSPVVYDGMGREAVKYLPYISTSSDGNFRTNAIAEQNSFNTAQFPGEQFYYSQVNYEASPFNRIVNSYAAGASWVGSNRGTGSQYLVNTATENVQIWNIDFTPGSLPMSAGSYSDGQLYKNVTTDERGKQVIEYKDKTGQAILKKVQLSPGPGIDHTGWLCTYYVYDVQGNLRYVLQPRAVELISSNWIVTQSIADELCFRYEYDSRNRMIVKKVPGAGAVKMVYDMRDRLVFTQDPNMLVNNQWLVTLYDALNRPVITAFMTSSASQSSLQQDVNYRTQPVDAYNSLPADISLTGTINSGSYVARNSIAISPSALTATNAELSLTINPGPGPETAVIDGISVNKSPVPSGTQLDILTDTYYDDYKWVAGSGTTLPSTIDATNTSNSGYFITGYNASPVYAQVITPDYRTLGMVTGTKTRILGTSNQYVYSVVFFDDHTRAIQTQSINITGGKDIITTQYDFTGKPLRALLQHQKNGTNAQSHTVLTKMGYDAMGRLLTTTKTLSSLINGQTINVPEKTIATNSYNELGQLQNKSEGNSIESLAYEYNIRGWLLGVNRNFVKDAATNYFGFELGYNNPTGIVAGSSYVNPQFNGNISGTIWKSKGDGEKRKYDFTYDNVNRLTGADFNQLFSNGWGKQDPNSASNKIDFSTSNLAYDANGNILSMQQQGWKLGGSVMIDSMIYAYMNGGVSNKLLAVTESATIGSMDNKLGDFTDKNRTLDDYTYDGNGNLASDKNKRITGILYNHLNLPRQIAFNKDDNTTPKGTISYTYDVAGNKLQKTVAEGSTTTSTLYLNGFEYKNDTLQQLVQEEGRIRYAKKYFLNGDSAYQFFYDYFLRDHLGNVRTVLTEQRDTAQYIATMEAAYRTRENQLFYNIPSSSYPTAAVPGGYPVDNTTSPNDSLMRLNGSGQKVGAAIVLRVMSGDTVDLAVKSFYRDQAYNPPNNPINDVLTSLASGIATVASGAKGSFTQLNTTSGPLYGALQTFMAANNGTITNKPRAYLNWMLLDERLNGVSTYPQSGAIAVGSFPSNTLNTLANTGINITKNGYLYIYVSNETPGWDVFFDNLSIRHYAGPLLEETHYYAFGLTMAGISSKALKGNYAENKYKFNSGSELQDKEFSDGSGLELYSTQFRSLDPQLGRWWQVDPKANESESPYAAMSNNPIRFNDILGDTIIDEQVKADKQWGKSYNKWLESKAGKRFVKLYSPGGKYGKTTVEFKVGKTNADNSAQGNTKVFDINRKTGASTELQVGKEYKGIDKVAEGKSSTDYLKFKITLREGEQITTPEQQMEGGEAIIHETQHVRIDQQTLSTNREIAAVAGQHYYWMKPTTSSWYQERAGFYLENRQMWQADYERQKAQGKVKNEAEYIKSKVNDFNN